MLTYENVCGSGLMFDWNLCSQSRYVSHYPVLYYLLIPCVLFMDGYCCQVCGKVGFWKIVKGSGWFCVGRWFIGVLKVGSVRLFVHHLDGDKDNSVFDNLVTVCGRCHSWLDAGLRGGRGMYLGYVLKHGHYVGYASRFRFREFWELVARGSDGVAITRFPDVT